jgi:hypothetical protein
MQNADAKLKTLRDIDEGMDKLAVPIYHCSLVNGKMQKKKK